MAHISAALDNLAQRHGHRITTSCNGSTRSAWELHDRVARLSSALTHALSLQPGDRVALLGHGTDVFFEALLAVADCGAIACPLNMRWSAAEAAAALALVQPKALLIDSEAVAPDTLASLESAVAGMTIIRLGPSSTMAGAMAHVHSLSTEQLMKQQQWSTAPQLQLLQPADGTALIVFTSGTTGASKGAALSHAALMHQSLAKLALVGYCAADVYLHIAPLFHVGGISSALAMLLAGGSHVFAPRYSAQSVVELVRQHSVTALIAVPAMIEDLVGLLEGSSSSSSSGGTSSSSGGTSSSSGGSSSSSSGRSKGSSLPSVQRLLVGAGGMSEGLQAAAVRVFPQATIMTAYGMTEAASSIAFLTLRTAPQANGQLPGSCLPAQLPAATPAGGVCTGWPAPGVQVRIEPMQEEPAVALHQQPLAGQHDSSDNNNNSSGRDASGSAGSSGRVGEVLTRGPHVMSRYWAAPEATSAVFGPGGWLRTGDMGYLDAAGRLWLIGRKKDMIKSGGENVHAAEVEALLCHHPGVAAAAVVALPHARLGEMVAAVVVLRQGWRWKGPLLAAAPAAPVHDSTAAGPTDPMPGEPAQQVLSPDLLRQHCKAAHLSGYKVPRLVAVRLELPRNASGKVVKRVLQQELLQTSFPHSKL